MLRLVIGLMLLVPQWVFAEGGMTSYREPTAGELEQQQRNVQSGLQQGEVYYQDETFRDKLSEQRARMELVPSTSPANKLEVPPEVMGQKWADAFNKLEQQATDTAAAPAKGATAPLVFASLSLPRDTLKLLAADAVRSGGAVIFRGLKQDDFRLMRAELSGLGEGFAIDPTMFLRFGITEVPSFVLPVDPVVPCNPNGCPPIRFVKVSGNVTVEAALEYIRINSQDPEAKALADSVLTKLRER